MEKLKLILHLRNKNKTNRQDAYDTMPLKTNRLLLRQWKQSDLEPFSELNSDPEVMEFFPKTLSRTESDKLARKIKKFITENGWGLWAVELISTHEFIGFVGLNSPKPEFPPAPCVEIGWRLARKYWGSGYATEAGQECLKFAFEKLKLEKIVSFTTLKNLNSQAVMERLGMINTHQNFMHPNIEKNSPLCEHVLYSITQQQWKKNNDQFNRK